VRDVSTINEYGNLAVGENLLGLAAEQQAAQAAPAMGCHEDEVAAVALGCGDDGLEGDFADDRVTVGLDPRGRRGVVAGEDLLGFGRSGLAELLRRGGEQAPSP
jgi:hypothetical protein